MLFDPATSPNLHGPPGAPAAAAFNSSGSAARESVDIHQQGGQQPLGCCGRDPACSAPCGRLRPLWDAAAVARLSHHPAVERVVAIGTVLAVDLKAQGGGGYSSSASQGLVRDLRARGLFARPLGSVVYVMVPPTSAPQTCAWLLRQLEEALAAS